MLLAEILSRKWALDSKRAERIASDARKDPLACGHIVKFCRPLQGFQRRSAGGQARFMWTKSGWGSDGRR